MPATKTAPASTCVPWNKPSSATLASVTTSVAFAELECEAAKIGGGSSDLRERNVDVFLFLWFEEAALPAAMGDGCRFVGFQNAFIVWRPDSDIAVQILIDCLRSSQHGMQNQGNACDKSCTNARCELPMRMISPGCRW